MALHNLKITVIDGGKGEKVRAGEATLTRKPKKRQKTANFINCLTTIKQLSKA